MGKTRKVYTAEFKREAVGLTKQPNATVEGVARDLGMSSSALHRWIREQKEKGDMAYPGHGKQALTAEQAEIQRLRRENEQLRLEREILKKATACLGQNGTPWGLPASLPGKASEVCVRKNP